MKKIMRIIPKETLVVCMMVVLALCQSANACEWYDIGCHLNEIEYIDFSILGTTTVHITDSCGNDVNNIFVYRWWSDSQVRFDYNNPKQSSDGYYSHNIKSDIDAYSFCEKPMIVYDDYIVVTADPREGNHELYYNIYTCDANSEWTSGCATSGTLQIVNVDNYQDYVVDGNCVKKSSSELLSSSNIEIVLPACVQICELGDVYCEGDTLFECEITSWKRTDCNYDEKCEQDFCKQLECNDSYWICEDNITKMKMGYFPENHECVLKDTGNHIECGVHEICSNGECIPLECDDNDSCTIDSFYNHECINTFMDSDSDSICDFYDICPDTFGSGADGCPYGDEIPIIIIEEYGIYIVLAIILGVVTTLGIVYIIILRRRPKPRYRW